MQWPTCINGIKTLTWNYYMLILQQMFMKWFDHALYTVYILLNA